MACFIEQGAVLPTQSGNVFSATGPVAIELTSGSNGTQLSGSADTIVVSSDVDGWIHVSRTAATDKAAAGKTRRILAGTMRPLGGVGAGVWVSFLADA